MRIIRIIKWKEIVLEYFIYRIQAWSCVESITADERNPSFTVHFNFISRWSAALAVVIFSALNIAPLYLFTRVIHNRKVATNRKHIHGCGHCYSVSRQDAPRRLYQPPITPLHTLSCVLLIFRDPWKISI